MQIKVLLFAESHFFYINKLYEMIKKNYKLKTKNNSRKTVIQTKILNINQLLFF